MKEKRTVSFVKEVEREFKRKKKWDDAGLRGSSAARTSHLTPVLQYMITTALVISMVVQRELSLNQIKPTLGCCLLCKGEGVLHPLVRTTRLVVCTAYPEFRQME